MPFMSKAQKKRAKQAREEKAREQLQLSKNWDRLKTAKSGIAADPNRQATSKLVKIKHRSTDNQPPSVVHTGKMESQRKAFGPKYSGEMALREAMAKLETKQKQKQVAPISNKGGYQYITDPADAKTVGRKV